MYTQCPECSVSFRVTAKVLKQAAGKVRCGGCGIAFNALDYLSEDKPQTDAQTDTDSKLPELTPEFSGDSTDQQRPKAISAEQSAALLKTLDQLAGEEIRIEDTGVEWRVLNVEELDEAEDDMADEQTSVADTGSLNFVLQDVEANGGDEVLEIVDEHEEAEPDSSQQAVAPEEMRFDDNTPLPDDFDLYRKPAVAPAPPPEIVDVTEPLEDYADANAELALGEPDEWEDLLGEVAEEQVAEASGAREEVEPGAGPVIEEQVETRPRAETEAETESESAADEPLDMDTQFALQAEAMGIDLSGIHHSSEAAETEATAIQDTDVDTSIDEDLIAAAFEAEAAARVEVSAAEELLDALDDDDVDTEPAAIPEEISVEEPVEAIEVKPIARPKEVAEKVDELIVPEQSEEELTINRMIDQDLLAIAIEDEDGFASTIVQKQTSGDDKTPAAKRKKTVEKEEPPDPGPLFETIILEGETVRGELDPEEEAAKAGLVAQARKAVKSHFGDEQPEARSTGTAIILGIIVLALLLVGQVIHQSREILVTVPAFKNSIGSIYRGVGYPVTPAWDVSGWRFEATKGSTDESDSLLTIYSRVGNASAKELPYPLVHVSLTDRFEEIVGSRVLEPTEYLIVGTDPRKQVAPGDTFNAVISIESPLPEATGFKLNVCYRLAGRELRCAIEDFK